MPQQLGKNFWVAYKAESTFNTPPGATGATRFRANQSPGIALKRAMIAPNEVRADLKTGMARGGSVSAEGSYSADLSVGTYDPLFEAVLRGTWQAALTITQATAGLTSVTQTTNSIVATAGSWITAGVKVGDVIRANITGGPAGNNNRNLRVTSVSATTLGIAETLTADATARTTFSITVCKKVWQATAPVRRSFTFEEYLSDADVSKQITGVRVSSMKIAAQPNGMATVDFGLVGADVATLSGASAPYYTNPTLTSSIGLVMVDATIRYAGADIVTLTSFDLSLDLKAGTQPVIGNLVTPDVFDNAATLSGSISGVRQDLQNLTRLRSETELELSVLLVEPDAEPKDFISIYVPRLKLSDVSAPLGNDGAMIETLPWVAGDKEVVSGYDDTMLAISTSAP